MLESVLEAHHLSCREQAVERRVAHFHPGHLHCIGPQGRQYALPQFSAGLLSLACVACTTLSRINR